MDRQCLFFQSVERARRRYDVRSRRRRQRRQRAFKVVGIFQRTL